MIQAIRLIAAHHREGRRLHLFVNISGKSLGDPGLLPLIAQELQASINPDCLTLEITETAAVADPAQARAFIEALKRLGCRFAIRRFWQRLLLFLPTAQPARDFLKIDGCFIRNLPHSQVDQHLVRAMAEMARGLGRQIIAEFVGDAATMDLLRSYGVGLARGYYFGRPGPLRLLEEPQGGAGG